MRIAVLASGRWAPFLGSLHSTAIALGELGHDVLLVDPPVSPLSVVRQPDRRRDVWARGVRHVGPGVRLWRPLVVPGQNTASGQAVNARLLVAGIRRHLGPPDLTITSSLEARGALARLPAPRVYMCIDSFEDLDGVDAERVRRRERELLGHVELAIAPSEQLTGQLSARGALAVTVPHGVDPEFLADPPPPPTVAASLARPLIGYVGAINFRVDASLIDAAVATTGGTLVLVGGSAPATGGAPPEKVADLFRRPDVFATGHVPRQEVRAWLGALDVAVVPYALTPFNQKSYPLKLLEYLAAGLPVVSSTNGGAQHLADLVRIADERSTFAAAVAEEVALDDPTRRRRRRDAMRARPWIAVAGEVLRAAGLAA